MADLYKAVCQCCGRIGSQCYGSNTGGTPNSNPTVSGNCPSHPSGKPNMPHSPRWERA